MNVLPPAIGVVMLIGISAAGISSASTFLSLIGFTAANDLMPRSYEGDEKKKLSISRAAMLAASIVILALAYFNPPQIFIIMYFGGTVIASSWSIVAFGSVWSRRMSKTGAYLGMLMGFAGCAAAKIAYSAAGIVPPIYLDPFFIGIALSAIGAIAGSALAPAGTDEAAERAALFIAPQGARDAEEGTRDHRLWRVYLAFAIFVGLFFVFMYALPYVRALQ